MKVFYATDLHGHTKKFKMIQRELSDHELLILGADILPKGDATIDDRKDFINRFLPKFFDSISIPIIIDFGNDDIMMLFEMFEYLVLSTDNVYLSHKREVIIGDYSFIGMHHVPDYPFGLKDWCRREDQFPIDPLQIHLPATTETGSYKIIPSLKEWLDSRPSMEDLLSWLPEPTKEKVVYNFHAPPRLLGFDICQGGRAEVGSYAITDFIMERKPLLTIHGHIHEAPFYSAMTINRLIPETVSIQPGQLGAYQKLVYCEFELENIEDTYVRKEVSWKKKNEDDQKSSGAE